MVDLSISDETLEPAVRRENGASAAKTDGRLSAARAQEIAETHDVPIEAVEAVAGAVTDD